MVPHTRLDLFPIFKSVSECDLDTMFKILIFILTMIATSSSLDFSTEITPRNPCTGLHIVEGIALVAWGGKIENDALKSTKDKTTQAQVRIHSSFRRPQYLEKNQNTDVE